MYVVKLLRTFRDCPNLFIKTGYICVVKWSFRLNILSVITKFGFTVHTYLYLFILMLIRTVKYFKANYTTIFNGNLHFSLGVIYSGYFCAQYCDKDILIPQLVIENHGSRLSIYFYLFITVTLCAKISFEYVTKLRIVL